MASKGKAKESEASILQKFNHLRSEQRILITKIAELEGDKNEHLLVLDALKSVDPERKCFRMVGGVLAERTAKDVIPSLQHNIEQLNLILKKLSDQLEEKGKEVNKYRETHSIRIRGENVVKNTSSNDSNSSTGQSSQGILVS